ncbi:membrane protease YdiL (CAAX protease family) [Chryseobacterium ginsenosidimutans]|uniref:CPBP family intramembrane glutamic endopeptidase n=1 Tax=Chryseobacterium ginsenosidimutans TaxID=687846 RepID=UPI00277DDC27|nr:type II CAAX endopeptidase family protein [Chryseobacterium ginsenosidimutans]MDQ0593967.1 membrane protease YdiL (CAAX protease family) [Chryseobacterium ginsenosidimutans]
MSLNAKYSLGILLTFVLLALVMIHIFPFINAIKGTTDITAEKFFYSRIAIWLVLIITILYNFVIEKNPFLVWKDKKYSSLFYIGSVICLYFICLIGGNFLNVLVRILTHEKFSDKLLHLSLIFKNNYLLIIFTCLTAGVVEELLMRGYIQPRIEKMYNNPYFGILISAILFGILHSTYGTVGQVVVPFFIGIVFAVFYKLYSNIKILIISHFMYDFVSLMIMNFIDIKHLSAFLTL